MANTQLVVFTPVPVNVQLEPDAIRMSVLVSPRLRGDEFLGAYPDWLTWTTLRQRTGLKVTFECAGSRLDVDVDTAALRPDLWDALFDDETFVRSHTFDDYSDEFVSSYSTRDALGVLKSTYQTVGIEFAAQDGGGRGRGEHGSRVRFASLIAGYALEWDAEKARRLRDQQRAHQSDRPRDVPAVRYFSKPSDALALDASGLIVTGQLTHNDATFQAARTDLVEEFGVFNDVPQGASLDERPLDKDKVLDFHQALSSLGAYPDLLRKLGLVFDVELPIDFVVETAPGTIGTIGIVAVDGGWNADTITAIPPTSTAYVHGTTDGKRRFHVASQGEIDQQAPTILGLLNLDPRGFGVAPVDVDGALHKTVMHADNLAQLSGEAVPPTADVFDPGTALSSLRSGGMSLFADKRALSLIDTFEQSKQHNADLEAGTPQTKPFTADDLTRGYRLDIWDSVTGDWHSLHRRNSRIHVGTDEIEITLLDEEGFFQPAVTRAAAEKDGTRANTDIHVHEAIARWSGWSLSAPAVGTHLTRKGDPNQALPRDLATPDPENEPVTPFKVTSESAVVKGSLPRLRFGVGYRLRLRHVDLAGNGLLLDDAATAALTPRLSMPQGDGVIPYLRFEPVVAPTVVVRDPRAFELGSSADRLVIRTFNSDPSRDSDAADLAGGDRHIAPPGTHVEMAERHGMLDDPSGSLISTAGMWNLVKDRDAGAFPLAQVPNLVIAGEVQSVPLVPEEQIDALPYLPDPLARAAAFRDLPGTSGRSIARVVPGAGAAQPVTYEATADPQPRRGTATIVEFGGRDDWQLVLPFRFALADGAAAPTWDPSARLLTVSVPKGTTHVVPLSACCDVADLKYLGVWAWLREYIEHLAVNGVENEFFQSPQAKDRIAHVLQLAAEGGHGMLTPPHLLTLVHAVQQPIGRPEFTRLTAQLNLAGAKLIPPTSLQTQPESAPTAETELDVLTSWRVLGSTDAFLFGALNVHAASTAKIDISARWTDPVDDLMADPGEQTLTAAVDELPIASPREGVLVRNGRTVGWYDPDHDLIAFAPKLTMLGNLPSGQGVYDDAAPRHQLGDTKHHVVTYKAVATSRYKEYFAPTGDDGNERDFTRTSEPVVVHVPASARPVAPKVRYVVPTFGWERVTSGNQVRSVRTGGGLRVYLDRPWHSSGVGELLGVTLVARGGPLDREEWKGFITQWGADPIWAAPRALPQFPGTWNFPDAVATEYQLPLDAHDPKTHSARQVDVAGHDVHYDKIRGLYYCDLTLDTETTTYMPFVRLALARYQPHALVEAKLSRVVLADFAQLTPERALMATADPFTPGTIRVAVSGPAPTGPVPLLIERPLRLRPTVITVTVQEKDPRVEGDLGWSDAAGFTVSEQPRDPANPGQDFILWNGVVRFTGSLESGRYRLMVREHEVHRVDRERGEVPGILEIPLPALGSRLVYAETVPLDDGLLGRPPVAASSTTL